MNPTPQDIAVALTKAGIDRLPPTALAYLSGRMGRSDLGRLNLGGLRPIGYGCSRKIVGQAGTWEYSRWFQGAVFPLASDVPDSQIAAIDAEYARDFKNEPGVNIVRIKDGDPRTAVDILNTYPVAPPDDSGHTQRPRHPWLEGSQDTATVRGMVNETDEFDDLDAAARALVSVAYRAAPRAWGQVGTAELATLDSYPIHRAPVGAAKAVDDLGKSIDALQNAVDGLAADIGATPSPIPGLPSIEDTAAAVQQVLSEAAAPVAPATDMGPRKVYPTGITPKMQATMRALVADWEGFDRLGVGTRVLPELRPAVVQFRALRDAWKSGQIDPAAASQEIDAATKAASQVRDALQKAGVIDPSLGPAAVKAAQETASAAQQAAASSSSWLDNVPALRWLNDPKGPKVRVEAEPIVPTEYRAPIVIGLAALVIVGTWLAMSQKGSHRARLPG